MKKKIKIEVTHKKTYQGQGGLHLYSGFLAGDIHYEIDLTEAQVIKAMEEANAIIVSQKLYTTERDLYLITEYAPVGKDLQERKVLASDIVASIDFDTAEIICQHIFNQTPEEQFDNGWTPCEFDWQIAI